MAKLEVWNRGQRRCLEFTGMPTVHQVLEQAQLAVARPCGGRGVCGKCAIILAGAVSEPNEAEQAAGCRLSCQAQLLGDAQVWLPEENLAEVETGGIAVIPVQPMEGHIGAAVDIGTTTIALKCFDLNDGRELSVHSCLNPQSSVAADVMGRIGAALDGKLILLSRQVADALAGLLKQAGQEKPDAMVITGNTTMLYLLTGRTPEELSHAPFAADCLFGFETQLLGKRTYLPRCMSAFVGADITCAVLASGMTRQGETALLCDIGTNGEMALWKNGRLYATSTAAGPAFEGAGISSGCGSTKGAIDRVWLENGRLCCHTIGQVPAVGVCGSGLIDAVAAALAVEAVDETGAMEEPLQLADGVTLLNRDIRAVQLAKAAIAAGIQTLLEATDTGLEEITTFYIAGGFGSHLNVDSAAAIGLIPGLLRNRVCVIGNGALTGAAMLLMDQSQITNAQTLADNACIVNLGGNSRFNEHYMENILFPAE